MRTCILSEAPGSSNLLLGPCFGPFVLWWCAYLGHHTSGTGWHIPTLWQLVNPQEGAARVPLGQPPTYIFFLILTKNTIFFIINTLNFIFMNYV